MGVCGKSEMETTKSEMAKSWGGKKRGDKAD